MVALPAWTGQTLNALFLLRQKERLERKSGNFVTTKTTPTYLNSFWDRRVFRVFIQLSVTDYLTMWPTLRSNTDFRFPLPRKSSVLWRGELTTVLSHTIVTEKKNFYGGILKVVVFIRRFRKIVKSDSYLRPVCPSVRMEQLGSHWTNFYETCCLSIFGKSVGKVKVSLKPEKNNGYFTWRPMYFCDNIALCCS